MTENHEQAKWEYLPGLLELMEDGVAPADLGDREFIAPQVRGTGLGAPLTPDQRSRLERAWDWLRGFRRESVLVERLPIWVPLVEIWAAPGGQADFSYEAGSEREFQAEITVFSLAGFGGASRRELTSTVRMSADASGVTYETRAFMTVQRYVNQRTDEEIQRVDVDCSEAIGEYRGRDLDPNRHPLRGAPLDPADLRKRGYVVTRIERRADQATDTEITLRVATTRSWKFEVAPELPMVKAPIKLGATCQRTRSFETTFVLPARGDYAFCEPRGQAPIVPLCVSFTGG